MPKKSNKQLQSENAALRAQLLQLSVRKESNDNDNDSNSVDSSQNSNRSNVSQQSVAIDTACNMVHYAVVELYPAAIAPCDIIVDVTTMWMVFQQFSFNPLNWNLTPNPFTPDTCDEDLYDLSPEGLLGALDRLDAITITKFSDLKRVYRTACQDARHVAALARAADADKQEIAELARTWLQDAVLKYPKVFTPPAGDGISDVVVTVTTHNLPPELKQKVRSIRRDLVDRVRDELNKYTKQNLHYTSDSKFSSPLVPVVKPDGDIRLCVDYTRYNTYITSPATPIPKIFEMVQDISEFNYYAEVDLSLLRLTASYD